MSTSRHDLLVDNHDWLYTATFVGYDAHPGWRPRSILPEVNPGGGGGGKRRQRKRVPARIVPHPGPCLIDLWTGQTVARNATEKAEVEPHSSAGKIIKVRSHEAERGTGRDFAGHRQPNPRHFPCCSIFPPHAALYNLQALVV